VSGEHSDITNPVGLSPENPIYPIEIVGIGIFVGVGVIVGVGIAVGLAIGVACSVSASFSLFSSIIISTGIKKAFSESGWEHPEVRTAERRATTRNFIEMIILCSGFIMLMFWNA
tara:strand:- start:1432 stop:1776 length:345 start_codon:yes stop_codon:yes gene_type:complete